MDFLALTDGGNPTPVSALGLRIPVAPDTWISIDFRQKAETALDLAIGWRSTRRPYPEVPRLAVVPLAGNVLQIEFALGSATLPLPLKIFPVDEPDREKMADMLRATTSGDPVGELLFRGGPGDALDAAEFQIGPPMGGGVKLKLLTHDQSALKIEVECPMGSIPVPGQPMTVTSLLVAPHAANLVSVLIREVKGAIPIV